MTGIPDDAAALELEEVEDHVADIMFTSHESPDPDCILCKAGIRLGVWAHYGVTDPFTPDDGS